MCDCEVGNGKKAYMTRESKKKVFYLIVVMESLYDRRRKNRNPERKERKSNPT